MELDFSRILRVPASDLKNVTLAWLRSEYHAGCQWSFEYFERDMDEPDDDYYEDDYFEPYDPLPQSAYDPYRYE